MSSIRSVNPTIVLSMRRSPSVAIALVLCASCAAPRRQPLDDHAIAESVSRRALTVADLEVALSLADLGALRIPRPSLPVTEDPADPRFWTTCAYLWEPGVRQARRRVESRRALARGAGKVEGIGGSVEHVGAWPDRETEAMATIDLLALLGIGPADAAKRLASAEVCDALGELEDAVWRARFRVLRALIRRSGALERERAAAALAREAAEDQPRIDALERAGRGVPADIAWSRATVERLKLYQAQARVDLGEAEAELAMAAGLPPGHAAFERLGASEVSAIPRAVPVAEVEPALLLATVPSLRALKLKYAVAEARLRQASSDRWPRVEVGPKGVFTPDMFLGGGVLDLWLPNPAATEPAVCAALVDRAAAREAVEDELVRVLARSRALRRQLLELEQVLERSTLARKFAAEAMWRAARAKFGSDDMALSGWNLALDTWLDASVGAIATRETIALLVLDLCEVTGNEAPDSESPGSRPAEGEAR
jgi:hypothetical protein